jgi:hypothetical protein
VLIKSESGKSVDYQNRPYQELAAAVILRAILDYQPGPNRKEQTETVVDQARDFLCGSGDFQTVRTVWCLWSGIQPESLTDFVSGVEDGDFIDRELLSEVEQGMLSMAT